VNYLIFALLWLGVSLIGLGLPALFLGKESAIKTIGFAVMTLGLIVTTLQLGELQEWNMRFLGGCLLGLVGFILRKWGWWRKK